MEENAKIFCTSFGEIYGATESHLLLDKKIICLSEVNNIIVLIQKKYVIIRAYLEGGEILSEKICFSDSKNFEWYHSKDLQEFADFLDNEGKEVTFWYDTVQA